MLRTLRPALSLFVLLSALTGLAYPYFVTALSQAGFAWQANGSVLADGHTNIGSALIGQTWSAPGDFWGRPSATSPQSYNGLASGGSNIGMTNPAQLDAVRQRVAALHDADPDNKQAIPVDLVTASGSGLDPDISLAAARYQVNRVARVRKLSPQDVQTLVERTAHRPVLGMLGTPVVNVLELNAALDGIRLHPVN